MSYTYLIIEDNEFWLDSIEKNIRNIYGDHLKNRSIGLTSEYTPEGYIKVIEDLTVKPEILFVDYELDWDNVVATNGEELVDKILPLYGTDYPAIIYISEPGVEEIKKALYENQFLSGIWTSALDKSKFNDLVKDGSKSKLHHQIEEALQFLKDRTRRSGRIPIPGLYDYPDLFTELPKGGDEMQSKYSERLKKRFKLSSKPTQTREINQENLLFLMFSTSEQLMAVFLYENDTLYKYLKYNKKDKLKSYWPNLFTKHGIEHYDNDILIYNAKYFWEEGQELRIKTRLLEKQLQTFLLEGTISFDHPFRKAFKKILPIDHIAY